MGSLVSQYNCVTGVRNDRLSLLEGVISLNWTSNFLLYPFIQKIDELHHPILILNRGSHYVNDSILMAEIEETFTGLFARYPNASVIYRNTPHGHGCFDLQCFAGAPLTREQAAEVYHDSKKPYHYEDFAHQNGLVQMFLEQRFPQVLYLDVFTSTVMRKDCHRDYLHYCAGAPAMSNWVNLIFNILNELNVLSSHAHSFNE